MIGIIVETVIGTVAVMIIAALGYKVYSLKKTNRELALSFLQESIDKNLINQKLEDTVSIVNNTNIEDKDGFIKFLSESREWAFNYIEDVQDAIASLDSAMIEANEEKISQAYKDLMKFMPNNELGN